MFRKSIPNFVKLDGMHKPGQQKKIQCREVKIIKPHLLMYTVLVGHQKIVWDVNWMPDGRRLVSCSSDQNVHICDVRMGTLNHVINTQPYIMDNVEVIDDNRLITTSSSYGTVWVDFVDNSPVYCILRDDGVGNAVISPNKAEYVVIVHSRYLMLVNGFSPIAEKRAFPGNFNGTILCVAWSPDGTRIVSCDAQETKVLNASTCLPELSIVSDDDVYAVACTNTHVAVAGASHINVYSMTDGSLLGEMGELTYSYYITNIQYSPDGQFIATACSNGTAHVWDATSGVRHRILNSGNPRSLRCVRWSPSGRQLAVCGEDKCIRVWTMCEWSDRTNYEFPLEVRNMVFTLMCVLQIASVKMHVILELCKLLATK